MNEQLFNEMARKGANIQIANLTQEIEEIYSIFPDLRTSNGAIRVETATGETMRRAGRTGRRKFSPAQRKAASERMKAMWAAKRRKK